MGEPAPLLLERSDEMRRLRAGVERAASGRGSVVLIEGPAGIGKTSLTTAAAALARDAGLEVLTARAGLLEGELPWNVVRQLFREVITLSEAARNELLAGAAGLAGPALGLAAGANTADEGGALHGLYWLTTALSERVPLLMAVDDAQWCDIDSLRFLAYVGERASDLPLLLTVTIRTGESQPVPLRALGRHSGVVRLALKALSPAAATELVRASIDPSAADEFCMACHAAASGNPFILNELLAQLRRDRVAPTAENARQVAQVTPESVKRSVLLRLSLLPAPARELATTVAVLGGDAELFEAVAVAGISAEDAALAGDALTSAAILSHGPRLSFAHPLLREVVYGDLPEHERGQRHRAAAEALARISTDSQRVAAQLVQAASLGDGWTVERLREAAQAALSEGAPQPAVEFLRRALREPPPSDSLRVAVLRELAAAEARSDSGAAIAHLEQALAAAQDPYERTRIAVDLLLMLQRHGQMATATELAHQVLESMPAGARELELAVIAAAVTGAILVPALHSHVDGLLRRIPNDLPGDTPEERSAIQARLAVAMSRSAPMPEVADLARRALGGGALIEDLPAHELLYWNAASVLIVADQFDTAHAVVHDAFEDARRRGSILGFALSSCFRCLLNYRVGNITEGAVDGRQAMDATSPAEIQIRAYAIAFLVDCLIERGELEEAMRLVVGPEFAGNVPDLFVFQLLRVARARAQIEAGDPRPGVEELLAVGETMALGQFSPAVCPWRARAAVGLAALGRRREAQELAEEALSHARATESAWGETIARQAMSAAAPQQAVQHLERALDLAERHGFKLEVARSLVLLGAVRRRDGSRAVATELLRRGVDASARCGALALEQRARLELAALGLRPRRRSADSDALTPAELRVAQLAAGGMSNRAIAQSLFLSLRTVETHLTHCYQKLGIDSRERLAAALEHVEVAA